MSTAEEHNQNAPIAFLLVVCAGLSTGIGAGFVFNKKLVKLASKRFLAGSLGLAAGVMLYVSLVEIFVKSQDAFVNHGYSESNAYLYATLSLFGGILFYKGIDKLVHLLEGGPVNDHNVDISLYDLDGSSSRNSPRVGRAASAARAAATKKEGSSDNANASSQSTFPHEHDVVVEISSGRPLVHPSPDLSTLQLSMAGRTAVDSQPDTPAFAMTPVQEEGSGRSKAKGAPSSDSMAGAMEQGAEVGNSSHTVVEERATVVASGDNDKLVRMGLMTAVAIGIHNFPEGLATFVGALSDPSVGFALAVAIAIHNIPEGLCVAIPVYYATGNRWKAFGWALLSGVSEPIGAGLGWLVLKDIMSELVYGILFGVVAGMMINISIHELIPTAVRYDPGDKVTTNSIVVGMAIMALSLVLFLY